MRMKDVNLIQPKTRQTLPVSLLPFPQVMLGAVVLTSLQYPLCWLLPQLPKSGWLTPNLHWTVVLAFLVWMLIVGLRLAQTGREAIVLMAAAVYTSVLALAILIIMGASPPLFLSPESLACSNEFCLNTLFPMLVYPMLDVLLYGPFLILATYVVFQVKNSIH